MLGSATDRSTTDRSTTGRPGADGRSVVCSDAVPSMEYSLTLFESFAIRHRGVGVSLPAPAERLVAALAISRSARSRSHLAGTLWPHKDESRALANLRAALWQINKRCDGLVMAPGGELALVPDVEVDLWLSLDWCEAVLTGRRLDHPPPVGPLARIEVLPTWSEDWLDFVRHYHRLQWLQALDDVGLAMLDAGDHAGALRCGLLAIGADQFHERGHEILISALIAGGNRVGAVRHYQRFKSLIEREISLPPSERLQRLVASIAK